MPRPMTFILCTCLLFMMIYKATAMGSDSLTQSTDKDSLVRDANNDYAVSDEKFDVFIENLIGKIQSNIQQSLSKKMQSQSDSEDRVESFDSLAVEVGDFRVAPGEIVEHAVSVKDGTVTVEGVVRGDVTVLRGTIVVKDGGRITGKAIAIGGTIVREKGGVVEGEIRESTSVRVGGSLRNSDSKLAYIFTPRWLHENLYSRSLAVRYNRVEGVYIGLASAKKFYWDGHRTITGYGSLGYGFALHRWRAQLGLDRQFATGTNIFEIGAEGHNLTDTKDDWIINQWENTIAAFLLREDYRDYFQRVGYSGHAAWYTKAPGITTMINVEYRYDKYESLRKNTNWSLFKNEYNFRDNPMVNDGTMNSGVFSGGISTVEKVKRSVIGWNTFAHVEIGTLDRASTATDSVRHKTDFTRAVIDIRRYQPLSQYDNLSMRIRFGALKGNYIIQKGFEIGGVNTLPAFGFKEFTGNRMVLGNIEYVLNGSVFEDVGFWPGFLTLIVFADAGDAQFAGMNAEVTDGFQGFAISTMKSDLGFAFGWHDGTARVGCAWRTDQGGPPMVFLRLNKMF